MGSQGKWWGVSQFFGLTFILFTKELGETVDEATDALISPLCLSRAPWGGTPGCFGGLTCTIARRSQLQEVLVSRAHHAPSSLQGPGGHDFPVPSGAENLSEVRAARNLSCRKLGPRPSGTQGQRCPYRLQLEALLESRFLRQLCRELGPDCRDLDPSL